MLCIVVFLDSLGPFLMMANSAYLYSPPSAGTTQSQLNGGASVWWLQGQDLSASPPKFGQVCQFGSVLGYDCARGPGDVAGSLSYAMQVANSLTMLCQGLAGFFSGPLTRRTGKKSALLIYTWVGGVFFILSGASKDWGSMYLYWLFRGLMGLFAGCAPVCGSLIADIWHDADPGTKGAKQLGIMTAMTSAVGIGPVIALIVNSHDLFLPLYVGGALEFVAGLLVLATPPIPSPPAPEAPPTSKKTDEPAAKVVEQPAPQEKQDYVRWMLVLWAARLFDRLGGGHIQYMITMKMTVGGMWEALQNPGTMGYIFLGVAVMLFLTIGTLPLLTRKLGMGRAAFVGQFAAGIGYMLLATAGVRLGFFVYTGITLVIVYFSMIAGFFLNGMVMGIVPASRFGTWMGYNTAFSQAIQALAPFALMAFLAMERDGELFDGAFLVFNALACLLSAAFYAVLTKKFPKPRAAAAVAPEESEAMRAYEETGDWKWLTSEQKREVALRRIREGKPPLTSRFGSFAEDQPDLQRIRKTADKNYSFISSQCVANVLKWQRSSPAEREEIRSTLRQFTQVNKWNPEVEEDVGKWVAEWMRYAGYFPPSQDPMFCKSIVMTAFPPLQEGGLDASEKFIEDPTGLWLRLERMMKMYIKQEREYSKEIALRGRLTSFIPSGV